MVNIRVSHAFSALGILNASIIPVLISFDEDLTILSTTLVTVVTIGYYDSYGYDDYCGCYSYYWLLSLPD
jgi:hypothetical protein